MDLQCTFAYGQIVWQNMSTFGPLWMHGNERPHNHSCQDLVWYVSVVDWSKVSTRWNPISTECDHWRDRSQRRIAAIREADVRLLDALTGFRRESPTVVVRTPVHSWYHVWRPSNAGTMTEWGGDVSTNDERYDNGSLERRFGGAEKFDDDETRP